MNIWELTNEAYALLARLQELDETEGADPAEQEAAIRAYFENEDAIEAKMDGYIRLVRSLAAMGKARTEEANSLLALGKADLAKAERLKRTLDAVFEARGWAPGHKITTLHGTVSRVANGGKPGVEIIDEAKVPARYSIMSRKPDMDAIRELLQVKAVKWAALKPVGTHIRINAGRSGE